MWLDESIFIFTLFVFEGCTLTIPRLPSAGFKMAKSGVWGRLHINDPPNCCWGDLRGEVALPDLVRLAKNGRRNHCAHRAAEPKTGKSSQLSKPQPPTGRRISPGN